MNLEFLVEYCVPIAFGTCLVIGYLVKHYSPINNNYIPWIVTFLGVVMNVWINNFAFTPEILFSGLLSGFASTGFHQALKVFIEKLAKVNEVE